MNEKEMGSWEEKPPKTWNPTHAINMAQEPIPRRESSIKRHDSLASLVEHPPMNQKLTVLFPVMAYVQEAANQ